MVLFFSLSLKWRRLPGRLDFVLGLAVTDVYAGRRARTAGGGCVRPLPCCLKETFGYKGIGSSPPPPFKVAVEGGCSFSVSTTDLRFFSTTCDTWLGFGFCGNHIQI